MNKKIKGINIGVVGYGYWGPNIVRNLQLIEGVDIISVCDRKAHALRKARETYSNLKVLRNYRDITTSPDIDAVVVVTPVFTHFEIARSALLNGKHVFVEKPFTLSVREAEKLIEIADKKNLKVMVDHTFLFTGAVRKIKELVDKNELGDLYYYDSTRINLGLFQHDINVIWDLLPHDLAVMNHLFKNKPAALSAVGIDHFSRGQENVGYVTIYFDNNIIAHFNVSWLSPVKIRTTLVGGTKKMLVWNDLEADEKIKIYDKGVSIKKKEGAYKLLVDYRSGDMWAPKLDHTEALKAEMEYFINYIKSDFTAINDGYAGLKVVKILEAANKSLRENGRLVKL